MAREESMMDEAAEGPGHERLEGPEIEALEMLGELSEQELEALEEAAIAAKIAEEERREQLGKILVKHRDDAVTYRRNTGIEEQWAEDQAYYEGQDETTQTLYYKGTDPTSPLIAKPKNRYRSKVFLNITRPYVETAASKVIEVLSPSDEPMWSFEPTSIPEMPEKPSPLVQAAQLAQMAPPPGQVDPNAQQGMQGQAPAPAQPPVDKNEEIIKAAKRAAAGAQLWIGDKLEQCDFSGQLRLVVDEAARLGTGILRGPVPQVTRKIKTTMDPNTGEEVIEVLQQIDPESKKISVWDAFPDPACGDNIHNGQFFIEHDTMVERQVRDLIGQPGYIKEALLSVIEEGPRTSASALMAEPPHVSHDMAAARFHVWYYYGFLKRDDVLAMGCSCQEADEIKSIGVPVIVTMINDTPVKAHLNQSASGRFPYDFMCWQKIAGSPFGIGISRQIRSCQAILNSHVRAMMENAGLSSGPQIILARGAIVPADGNWEITPRKVWLLKADSDVQDVSQAFNSVVIPSVQQDLLQAIEFALKMAENVTGLPILLQGQQGPNGVPETVGGMQILVANASSLLRRMARIFDDCLIKPHMQAYYDWMMEYGDDPSIKGDFRIVAHGSSALVARDQRNIFITQVAPQLMANPGFGIDPTKLFKEIARISGIHAPETLMFSPEEMAALQQAQAQALANDPKLQVANINSQTRLQVAAMQNETDQFRVARDIDRDNQYISAETMRTQVTGEIKMAELQMRERLAMLEYANTNNITLDKLKTQLAIEAGRNDLARELATLPTVEEVIGGVKDNAEAGRNPEQLQPAGEPAGKAPSGMGPML